MSQKIKYENHTSRKLAKSWTVLLSRSQRRKLTPNLVYIYQTGSYEDVLITESSLDALAERSHFDQKKNIVKRLTFTFIHKDKDVPFWKKKIFWGFITLLLKRMGPDCKMVVQRQKCQTLNPCYGQRAITQGRGRTMEWKAFSWHFHGMKKWTVISI